MNKSIRGYWAITAIETVFCAVCAMLVTFFFLSKGMPIGAKVTPFLVGGLFLLAARAIYCAFSSRTLTLSLSGPEADKERFDALSDVPIKGMAFGLLADLAFAISEVIYFSRQSTFLNVDAFPLCCLMAAMCMLYSGASYVFLDRVVSRTVASSGITEIGQFALKAKQRVKTLIIPSFVCVMSVVFGVSEGAIASANTVFKNAFLAEHTVMCLGLASAYFVASVLALMFAWSRSTGRLYDAVISQCKAFTSRDRDLTARVRLGSIDELATISDAINKFCSGLNGSVKSLKACQDRLLGMETALSGSVSSTAASIGQVATSVSLVDDKASSQVRSVESSSAALGQVSKGVDGLNSLVKGQEESVSEASASIEEMVGNILSISSSMDKIDAEFKELLAASADGLKKSERATSESAGISEASKALVEANKAIANIAYQTNLLAMNAAIEAAHAGDAGRGFAVVADEIRKLSEVSSKQSRDMRQSLKAVQERVAEVIGSVRDSGESFKGISSAISNVGGVVSEVRGAVGEQNIGSKEILSALRSITSDTASVRTASGEMAIGAHGVLAEMESLKSAAIDIKKTVEEMLSGINGLKSYAGDMTSLSGEMAAMVEEMDRELKRFVTK